MIVILNSMELFDLYNSQINKFLNEGEKQSIYKYSDKENGIYSNLNFKLRHNLRLTKEENQVFENLISTASKIRLNKNLILYRGMNASNDFYEKIINDSEVTLKGVISTSFSKKIARKYSKGNGIPIVFVIKLSKGTNCIPVFLYGKYKEREIAFINLKLKIISLREKHGILFVNCTN